MKGHFILPIVERHPERCPHALTVCDRCTPVVTGTAPWGAGGPGAAAQTAPATTRPQPQPDPELAWLDERKETEE